MQCLNHLVFDRRALPDGFQLQGPTNLLESQSALAIRDPILINRDSFSEAANSVQKVDEQHKGLEIVPWKPIHHVIALHVLADFIDYTQATPRVQNQQEVSSVILLRNRIEPSPEFEFESAATQPNPPRCHVGRPPKARNTSSSANNSNARSSSTPLVKSAVRHSPRIRGDKDGFKHVHLGKRQRREVHVLSIPAPDGNTGPIPTEILHSWGISCGVQPESVSDEVLFQALASSSIVVPHEDYPSTMA